LLKKIKINWIQKIKIAYVFSFPPCLEEKLLLMNSSWKEEPMNTKILFFYYYLRGCPGQLAHTTTSLTAHWTSCKPSEHVRHHGGNRHAQGGSNPGAEEGNKSLPPLGQYLKCWTQRFLYIYTCVRVCV
jgi:hypothetical protein